MKLREVASAMLCLRQDLHWSQIELSEQAGASLEVVANAEAEIQMPTPAQVLSIGAALKRGALERLLRSSGQADGFAGTSTPPLSGGLSAETGRVIAEPDHR